MMGKTLSYYCIKSGPEREYSVGFCALELQDPEAFKMSSDDNSCFDTFGLWFGYMRVVCVWECYF